MGSPLLSARCFTLRAVGLARMQRCMSIRTAARLLGSILLVWWWVGRP